MWAYYLLVFLICFPGLVMILKGVKGKSISAIGIGLVVMVLPYMGLRGCISSIESDVEERREFNRTYDESKNLVKCSSCLKALATVEVLSWHGEWGEKLPSFDGKFYCDKCIPISAPAVGTGRRTKYRGIGLDWINVATTRLPAPGVRRNQ